MQPLRAYQRVHRLDRAVTWETIRAHVLVGQEQYARQIIAEVKNHAPEAKTDAYLWIDELDTQLDVGTQRRHREDREPTPIQSALSVEETARFELFTAAMHDGNWNQAFEVAMGGLPKADRSDGDSVRVELLESIPLERLDSTHTFSLALTLARLLSFGGRDADAHQWSHTTQELAATPNQRFAASIVSALVGVSTDERTPISFPEGASPTTEERVNVQSLHVVIINHLERASFERVAPLQRRFTSLVEASADPYRRWGLMTLQSMT